MHHLRTARTAAAGALAAVLLATAACGTSENTESGKTAASGDPVSVTDDRGTEIKLDAPATKVVSLEWNLTEDLLALGVAPVGVADVEGYITWDKTETLDPKTLDVGTRGEPSLDSIIKADPDLVVTTADLPETVIEQIEDTDIPVLVVDGADAADPIGQMRDTMTLLGEVTGKQAEATEALADYDEAVAEAKKELAAAGKDGSSFVMVDGWIDAGTISIRGFTNGSMLGAIGTELGLTNAWVGEGDEVYGLSNTDLEALTQIEGDPAFLYIINDADNGKEFEAALADNTIWTGLSWVKSGNTHRLADGIWMFGGPSAAEDYIDAMVDAITGDKD